MANPFGVTMQAFEIVESAQAVVRKGASDVLGQVASISLNSNVPTRKVARVGDTSKSTSYQPTEHSGSIVIYTELDPDEFGALFGVTKPASGGWAGTEVIRLNPTIAAFDVFIDIYDAATGVSGDDKVGIWTLDNFKPTSLQVQIESDTTMQITVNFECDDIFYEPEAGVGA